MTIDANVPSDVCKRLIKAASTDGLVLFVGAGINANENLTWKALLQALFQESLQNDIFGRLNKGQAELTTWAFDKGKLNYYEIADLTKFTFGDANTRKLKRFLYQDGSAPGLLLSAVAKLCASPAVRSVVTYNFDDYLERAVAEVAEVAEVASEDNKCNSQDQLPQDRLRWLVVHYSNQEVVYRAQSPLTPEFRDAADRQARKGRRLDIYHVHGYIPNAEHRKQGPAQEIVFSQAEYYLNMLNPHSWQTTTQLHYLRNYHCLFIGASLSDMDMNRLLLYSLEGGANKGRWAIMAEQSFFDHAPLSNAKLKMTALRMKATILARLGIELIIGGVKFDELDSFIDRLLIAVMEDRNHLAT